MYPNWTGVLSAMLSLAAFWAVRRAAARLPFRRRALLAAWASVAAVPGLSFAVYYTHLLPERAWYYHFRSLPGTELLMVFVGIAGGLMASLRRGWPVSAAAFLGVAAVSLAPVMKPFLLPLEAGNLRERWDGDVCRQSTGSTCGPASLATVLRSFGAQGMETESRLAGEAHTCASGTEGWYLARAAAARGFRAWFDFHPGFTPDPGLPAVVGVRLGAIGHFIAVLGREGNGFVIGDPERGREVLTLEQLHRRYEFTGFHLRVAVGP